VSRWRPRPPTARPFSSVPGLGPQCAAFIGPSELLLPALAAALVRNTPGVWVWRLTPARLVSAELEALRRGTWSTLDTARPVAAAGSRGAWLPVWRPEMLGCSGAAALRALVGAAATEHVPGGSAAAGRSQLWASTSYLWKTRSCRSMQIPPFASCWPCWPTVAWSARDVFGEIAVRFPPCQWTVLRLRCSAAAVVAFGGFPAVPGLFWGWCATSGSLTYRFNVCGRSAGIRWAVVSLAFRLLLVR